MANITFGEAAGVNESIYGKSQAAIRMIVERKAEAYEKMSVTDTIFNSHKSTSWGEKYTSLTAMDGFRVTGENGAAPNDGMEEGYSKIISDVIWRDRFSLTRKIVEDSKAIDLRKRPEQFIKGYYRVREMLGAAMIGNAIQGNSSVEFRDGTFDLTGADGQNLFYASHPAKVKGGTQCNLWSDAFSDDALGMLETKMQNTFGDNGELLGVAPDTIIIPNLHPLKKAVFAAIGADKEPTTANNGWNYQYGRWNVIVWNYLNQYIASGTAPWILFDSSYNQDYDTLIWQERIPLDIQSFVDMNTRANVWDGYARFGAGFHDWRGIAVAGVSGATDLS